ncbi:hypothetical protein CYLTODRAFT_414576 [Cylindrobasidium torrendii FP15055 ss-10]|uniref:BTB domain-containing protein n=1 Tax=Cylindrobasidium torrendii FP15055 ss-10 TaxID=1314674 RepID=A0A0D7AXE0_9AGAR|nr:hypothetical protein CYLTODRAFT_414576 [Cylindrobasidium torrendii FP15055 ss-10]
MKTTASLPRAEIDNLPIGEAPFDSETDADVVLRTSDNILLFTQKSFLVYASPFFCQLFSGPPQEIHKGCTVCTVAEDQTTIRAILLLCAPIDVKADAILPALYNLKLHDALEKYGMGRPRKRLVSLFHTNAQQSLKAEPLRAFAIARFFKEDFGGVAKEAASQMLKYPLASWPDIPELKLITGREYQALMNYFLKCVDKATSVLSAWIDRGNGKSNQCSLECSSNVRSSTRCDLLERTEKPYRMLHILDSMKGEFVKDTRILLCKAPGADIEPELRYFLYEASGGACNGKQELKSPTVSYMAMEVAERVKAAISKVELVLD